MRLFIAGLMCVYASGLVGCSMFQRAYNYQANAIKEHHDDFKNVGEEGRAELPREKETDKLTPLLQSPQARAIEKNLGYD
jgi:hypothetical protein